MMILLLLSFFSMFSSLLYYQARNRQNLSFNFRKRFEDKRAKSFGARSCNRKQTCYLYNLYCCPHVAIVFSTDFGGWGESTRKLFLKIHQYLCNRTTYESFVCFCTKFKSPSLK